MFEITHTSSRRQFIALCAAGAASAGAILSGLGADRAFADEALSDNITAMGSTALQPLVEAAAEQFMAEQPGVQISIQGGGSGQGIAQIVAGSVQIGNSDVFAESKLDDPTQAENLVDNKVCVVGMGPVANPEVGVTDIAMEDLTAIFTGAITNWSDLGGADQEIVVINRAAGSGTRATFESVVLADTEAPADFTPQEQDSSGTVAQMVSQTPGAISYLAFSYYSDDLAALSVDGVEPTEDNVASGDWKIWAYEHMYTAKDADEATQAFIDYMLSDAVQGSLVESTGYIPISKMKVEKDAEGNMTEDGEAKASSAKDAAESSDKDKK